jgi:hypothetical protein
MALLAQRPDRYLHSPRLVLRAPPGADDACAELACIAWLPAHAEERLLHVDVAPDGSLGAERWGEARPAIVHLTRGERAEASDAAEAELEEARAGERVWIEHRDAVGSVWLARGAAAPILVFRARGCLSAPTLARSPAPRAGTWIAFHHDVREDTGAVDVAKWIALRFVDAAGAVFEPAAPMRERDRDREGVEQSFEFPALALGADGALALFGRGSHNFWRQDLTAAGFGPRIALSDGEWGSRGRRVAALATPRGILVARRERKGIQVDLLAPAEGGAPALAPARVDLVPAQPPASPARARDRDPAGRHGLVTLFGDIQQHSAHSDGVGSAEEVYLRARHRYGDDFVALTDHESFLGKRTSPGEWEYLQRVAERHDEPGRFATLYAYEWTGKAYPGPGHKCVYYPRRGVPIVSRDDVPEGRRLVQAVRALGGFASPHHIGWTGADEPGHDDDGQPLWEICSCHGCYEHASHPLGQRGVLGDQMADVMLKKGHRFGFTASSDSHGLLWHHGEARKRDPYRTGLTAVQAQALTRQAIMDALRARRCYATSGAKILLDLRADGFPMGSELEARRGASFEVHAVGTCALRSIELVSEAGVVARAEPSGLEGTLYASAGGAFVYARVVQEDGEMAWSSPVFFGPRRRPAEGAAAGVD